MINQPDKELGLFGAHFVYSGGGANCYIVYIIFKFILVYIFWNI